MEEAASTKTNKIVNLLKGYSKIFQWSITFIVLIIFYFIWVHRQNENVKISKDVCVTIAVITDYISIGIGNGDYVTYTYKVNGLLYVKEVNYGEFLDCDKTRDCIGKKFFLFYKRNDPDSSFIDFQREFAPCNLSSQ